MKKIFVAGHRGMVGSAICRQLHNRDDIEIITRNRDELNLCDQLSVHQFMKIVKPDEVILAAAKVGGIHANNTYPAEFIYQNLQIQNNVIHAAHENDVQKLLFLGSSCIYPRQVPQPMQEESLLTGLLEPTNEPYAIAKIAGIKMCGSYNRQYGRDYRSVMPTNLYGPGDNFSGSNSHVIPALIRKLCIAKETSQQEVCVWGDGTPLREFLHVDDLASAAIFVHELEKSMLEDLTDGKADHINIGYGEDISIKDLVKKLANITGFTGKILFGSHELNGTQRKLLDCSKINKLGWTPKITLDDGLTETVSWYKNNKLHRIT